MLNINFNRTFLKNKHMKRKCMYKESFLFFLAFKNNKSEKYDMDHQTAIKNGEITNNFEMQKRIDEADLKIASVSQKN